LNSITVIGESSFLFLSQALHDVFPTGIHSRMAARGDSILGSLDRCRELSGTSSTDMTWPARGDTTV
jgi:hypothetical protein